MRIWGPISLGDAFLCIQTLEMEFDSVVSPQRDKGQILLDDQDVPVAFAQTSPLGHVKHLGMQVVRTIVSSKYANYFSYL